MKIMFICTGNICRSAMAHAMLKQKAKEKNKKIDVYSCGVFARNGEKSTEEAIQVLKTIYNIDLTQHRATYIEDSQIKQMDVILCATTAHKKNVLNMYPQLEGKVFTMKEYANYPKNNQDIKDPWGCSYEIYEKCAKEINECLDKIIEKI